MSNGLTNLMPDLYEALDIVSREMVGFIPAVTLDASAEAGRATSEHPHPDHSRPPAAEDITPGQLPPDDGDQTIGNTLLQITKSRMVPFRWSGEEQKGVNTGPGYAAIRLNQVTQAMRTLTNEIDAFVGNIAALGASRAWGTAGTTAFATDLSDPANIRKILSDNGAPLSDLQMVIDTTAGAKVRSLAQLTKANEAGTTTLREQGTLLDIHGFKLRGIGRRPANHRWHGYRHRYGCCLQGRRLGHPDHGVWSGCGHPGWRHRHLRGRYQQVHRGCRLHGRRFGCGYADAGLIRACAPRSRLLR